MAKNTPNRTRQEKASDEMPDPSVPSAAYQKMAPKWAMINTLLGGTDAMRGAERMYLPQHAEESNLNYMERIARATLFNMFELTLESLVGKVFVDPVKLNDDVPPEVAKLEDDIDLLGTNLTTFAREWFRKSMSHGFAHVFIDMPKLSAEDKQTRTLADDYAENRRPYWKLVSPDDVIFAYASVVNGVEVLQQVRIRETYTEVVGFVENIRHRIRVLTPGHWELWELKPQEKAKDKPQWFKIEEGDMDCDEIPLVTFYANREDFMLSKPPLEDLGHMNVAHWQSVADQRNILTVARFPMLAGSGIQQAQGTQEQMAIGPRQLLTSRDPQGRFYYVEHSGRAIGAGRIDIQDLEAAMASYGAEFLRRKIGGRTATERALDSSEAISPLRDIAQRFQNAINRALGLTADWLGVDIQGATESTEGGTCTINTEFTEDDVNNVALQTLSLARDRGDLSRKTWLKEMKRLEVVAPDLDVEEEMKQIEWEAKNLVLRPTSVKAVEQIRANEDITASTDESPSDLLNDTGTLGGDSSGGPQPATGAPPKQKGNKVVTKITRE
jgi:hypothetical protein